MIRAIFGVHKKMSTSLERPWLDLEKMAFHCLGKAMPNHSPPPPNLALLLRVPLHSCPALLSRTLLCMTTTSIPCESPLASLLPFSAPPGELLLKYKDHPCLRPAFWMLWNKLLTSCYHLEARMSLVTAKKPGQGCWSTLTRPFFEAGTAVGVYLSLLFTTVLIKWHEATTQGRVGSQWCLLSWL